MDRDWALIVLVGVGFGSAFFFHELLLREMGPLHIGLGRLALAAIACWTFLLLTGRSGKVPAQQVFPLAILGLFNFLVPFVAFTSRQQFVGAGYTGIVNAMTPAFTVVIAQFWPGGEGMNRHKLMGVIAGFIGVSVLVSPQSGVGNPEQLTGTLILLAAPIGFACALNWIRSIRDVSPFLICTWALTFAALFVLPAALVFEGVPNSMSPASWVTIGFVGFVLTAVGFQVLFGVLPRAGPTKVASVTYIIPISAIFLGAVFLGERLEAAHAVGIAAIFAGLLLIDRGRSTELKKAN